VSAANTEASALEIAAIEYHHPGAMRIHPQKLWINLGKNRRAPTTTRNQRAAQSMGTPECRHGGQSMKTSAPGLIFRLLS
jgi:hypothetical protein